MTELLQGIDITIFIQQLRTPFLESAFRTITLLGEEEFYLLVLPLIFWCVDSRTGIRLTFLVFASHYLNTCVKDFVQLERPFYHHPEVKLANAAGYSFPSNHAQTGLVFWLGLAWMTANKRLWFSGIFLVLIIGLSRVYLGVHFATDVLAGWIFGASLLLFFVKTEQQVAHRLARLSTERQIMLAGLIPLLLFFVHPVKDTAAVTAALSGAWFGLICQRRYIPSAIAIPHDNVKLLLARALAGLLVLMALWLGLKGIFPQEGADYYLLFRYIRYCFCTVWITFGAPCLFSVWEQSQPTKHNFM